MVSRWVHRIRKQGNLISIVAVIFALASTALKEHYNYNDNFKDAESALQKATDKLDLLKQFESLRDDIFKANQINETGENSPQTFEERRQSLITKIANLKEENCLRLSANRVVEERISVRARGL